MNKIIYIPLENLPQRYTKMMNDVIIPKVHKVLYPGNIKDKGDQINQGEFLDIIGTCKFKSKQLQLISRMFEDGEVQNFDTFLIADIFFPGIEMIRYMADLLGIKVFIFGFNYAGRADKTDFVQKLGAWSDSSERGYHEICDGIFVGSKFHKANIGHYFGMPIFNRTVVTGYIWDEDYAKKIYSSTAIKKLDQVIWPHRMSKEKGFEELIEYANSTDKKILITSSGEIDLGFWIHRFNNNNIFIRDNLSKADYYEYLNESRWYLSTAYQETFGYTLQEAMLYGCEILVPNRACYPEMVPKQNLYNHINEIDHKFNTENLLIEGELKGKWHNNVEQVFNYINEYISSWKSESH